MTRFATPSTVKLSSGLLAKPASIYEYTHASASSLVTAFDDAKTKRGNVRGVLTDQEQDILRASLVMCCAGVDAALKQAIRDCFETLLEKNKPVREGFEKFIRKRIGGEGDVLEIASGVKFLAQVLADKAPRAKLRARVKIKYPKLRECVINVECSTRTVFGRLNRSFERCRH